MKRYIRSSDNNTSLRQRYIRKCIKDAPQLPYTDPADDPEGWAEYYMEYAEYRGWCFIEAVDDHLFSDTEDEQELFYDMWDKIETDIASQFA